MSLFSTLNTGVSGLNASELAIATTSQNISNANNEYYTRQRVQTSARTALDHGNFSVGTGTSVTSIVRIHDEFVYTRLKDSANSLAYSGFSQQSLQEVAQYFPDLQDVGLQVDLTNYNNAWNDFASNPEEGAQKINLIQSAQTLTTNIQDSRSEIRSLQDSINDQLKTNVDQLNSLGQQIADINKEIAKIESIEPNRANDLRDQRDKLELTMSELIDFDVFKGQLVSDDYFTDANLTDQGKDYHLNIAGFSFVDGITFHEIVIDNSKNQSAYYSLYHEQQDGRRVEMTTRVSGGEIGAMLDLRGRTFAGGDNSTGYPQDGLLQGYIDNMDTFAKALIVETNNVYAKSAQDSMESMRMEDLNDDAALTTYDSSIQKGTFDVVVYDASGNEVARKEISIDSATTMSDDTHSLSIVTQFNSNSDDNNDNNAINDVDDYFTANYGYDNKNDEGIFSISPNPEFQGYTVAIEDQGTNFPGALGVSRFFEGTDAQSIAVDRAISNEPDLLQGFSSPISGNNTVANDMVQLQYETVTFYHKDGVESTDTIEAFYRYVTATIATDTEAVNREYETNNALYNTVFNEFQSISGVNIDEELTDLMKFQTSYSANAKILTTIDQMLDTLLGIKQ